MRINSQQLEESGKLGKTKVLFITKSKYVIFSLPCFLPFISFLINLSLCTSGNNQVFLTRERRFVNTTPPNPEMLDAQVITEVYLQGTKTRQVEYFFVVPFLVKINTTDMQLKHFSITIGKELSLQIVTVLFSANHCFEILKNLLRCLVHFNLAASRPAQELLFGIRALFFPRNGR